MTVSFSNLPVDVLEKVVAKTALTDCLSLRKVCRDLRNLLDSLELHCELIVFKLNDESSEAHFDQLMLVYEATDDGGCLVTSYRYDTEKAKEYRDDRNFTQVMITDLSSLLCNSKLKIGMIYLDVKSTETWTEFLKFLKSLKTPLNVQSIKSLNLESLHAIVPVFNQEKLEEITFRDTSFNIAQFTEIVKTDAAEILKHPKFKISYMIFDGYTNESASKFSKILKSFDNQLNFQRVCITKQEWIYPFLRSLNPENVEEISLENVEFTVEKFNEVAGMGEEWKKRMSLMCFDIPGEIGIEQFVHFMDFYAPFKITDENLVKVRDILLKSPHLQDIQMISSNDGRTKEEAYEQLDRIMSENPNYDAQTHQMSIPNSSNYFWMKIKDFGGIDLHIRRL